MPSGSVITITYDGTQDISNDVIYAKSSAEILMAAAPGRAEFHVRDLDQTLSFTTGRDILVELDGLPIWAGYIQTISRTYPLPVMDTVTDGPDAVERVWILRCVDLNILFDKRVLRNTSNYTTGLQNFTADRYDGDLIRTELTGLYLDLADDNLDTTSEVEDITRPNDPELVGGSTGQVGGWQHQGAKWREQMQDFAQISGAIWYIAPTRKLFYKPLEDAVPSWGFSDTPNGTTTIGFREAEIQEDASQMVNDAFVWGGAGWAGGDTIVFARETNTASITAHQRWQLGEIHFGQDNFKTQDGVDARAEVIVNGAPGSVPGEPARGLQYPQYNAKLVWHSLDVPGGNHLVAGQIVTITLNTHDLVLTLPLRSVRMSFPILDDTGKPYVRFEGQFSLQLSDPKTLWSFILRQQATVNQGQLAVSTASGSSTSAVYGAFYSDAPIPLPNGSITSFTLNPQGFTYIAGTTQVFKNGLLQIPGSDYTESDPLTGQITFTYAPLSSDTLWIMCRLANTSQLVNIRSFSANAVIT